jgi:hypothetical protein
MTNLMIATPAYGGQVTERYLQSLLALVFESQRIGLSIGVFTQTGESLITRARNNMLQTFIDHPEYDQLLWIDADIGFDTANVLRLVHSEHEVTATPYPLKTVNWDAVAGDTAEAKAATSRRFVINRLSDEVDPGGFSEALDAGTGFMCIKRSAIEKLMEAYPDDHYLADDPYVPADQRKRWLFFDTMLEETEEGRRYLSEDYAFARKWQNIGGKLYVDVTGPPLRHYGGYAY